MMSNCDLALGAGGGRSGWCGVGLFRLCVRLCRLSVLLVCVCVRLYLYDLVHASFCFLHRASVSVCLSSQASSAQVQRRRADSLSVPRFGPCLPVNMPGPASQPSSHASCLQTKALCASHLRSSSHIPLPYLFASDQDIAGPTASNGLSSNP